MLTKNELAREIGCFFGTYFKERNQFCIDNDEKVFRYDTVDALLKDWLDTLIECHRDAHHFDEYGREWDSWEKEIIFIYQNVIGKYPAGIRAVPGKDGPKWSCSVDVTVPGETSPHGKNLYLGTYDSIVDAIYARKEFKKIYDERKFQDLTHLSEIAHVYQDQAKTKGRQENKRLTIDFFQNVLNFQKKHGITALSPVKVMLDLHQEVNLSPSELYILATKMIDGMYRSDDPFLYGERIAAIKTIVEDGFLGNLYLDDMSPDDAYNYMLYCSPEELITIVDIMAKENQEYYTASWLPESMDHINESVRTFLARKPSLENKIEAADGQTSNILNTKATTPDLIR